MTAVPRSNTGLGRTSSRTLRATASWPRDFRSLYDAISMRMTTGGATTVGVATKVPALLPGSGPDLLCALLVIRRLNEVVSIVLDAIVCNSRSPMPPRKSALPAHCLLLEGSRMLGFAVTADRHIDSELREDTLLELSRPCSIFDGAASAALASGGEICSRGCL